MRGRAEPKNHNPTLYIFIVLSPLKTGFFYGNTASGGIQSICPLKNLNSFLCNSHQTL